MPPPAFKKALKRNPIIIFIDNYQRQTPCKQTGLAGIALQQQRFLSGHAAASNIEDDSF